MSEISNKSLAALLVLAIVISLGGTIVSLGKIKNMQFNVPFFGPTGFATKGQGNVTINVTTVTSIQFIDKTLDFGNGYVTSGGKNCTMYINESNTTTTVTRFNTPTNCSGDWASFGTGSETPLILENNGNSYLNVTIQSDKDASTFIGGNSDFKWQVSNHEANSCGDDSGVPYTWTTIAAATPVPLCQNLSYDPSKNTMSIGFEVRIPEVGAVIKGSTQKTNITATATELV